MRGPATLTKATASVAAMAAIAVVGAAAADAAVPRQVGSLTYTSKVPGTSTGLVLNFLFQNPENANQKPHAVAKMVVHSPAGSHIDTTVPPQCHASDAQLMVQGAAACPADAKIGSAVVVSDTGGSGPFPRYTRTIITDFNNQDEILAVGQNQDIPVLRPVDHTKIQGNTTTTNFPPIPGAPPPDAYTPFKSFHFEFSPYVRDGRVYNRTPPTCPSVGYWTMTLEFTYRDGVTQSEESHSPCQQAQATHPPKKPKKKKRHHRHHRHHRHRADSDRG
ncbi:MAG: hypothetical protein QOK25_2213 [Thermoleophilaceae bacterium]|nr:hypothetical protein [Thermoleophilaceae bacterium]